MARPEADQRLVPSVIDRLIDERPRSAQAPPEAAAPSLPQLKEAVKRDLEWLLNSRQVLADLPGELRQLDRSLLTYGLPDFTSATLSNTADQDLLRRSVEDAIRRFEPRLRRFNKEQPMVTLEPPRPLDRSLRFRIDAMLIVEPEPQPISFDSVLQLNTKMFVVSSE
jgi:type VI secretion system protein ImpF